MRAEPKRPHIVQKTRKHKLGTALIRGGQSSL